MISIAFTFPTLSKRLSSKLEEVDLFVAAQLQTNRGLLFDSEGGRNGHQKWAKPLFRSGQAGSSRGMLRKSIAPGGGQAGPGGYVRRNHGLVTIGTKLVYAAMFNYGTKGLPGGKLVAQNGVLRIPLPAGKAATDVAKTLPGRRREAKPTGKGTENVIYRKWVKIPARDFRTLTSGDQREIALALKAKLAELLGG